MSGRWNYGGVGMLLKGLILYSLAAQCDSWSVPSCREALTLNILPVGKEKLMRAGTFSSSLPRRISFNSSSSLQCSCDVALCAKSCSSWRSLSIVQVSVFGHPDGSVFYSIFTQVLATFLTRDQERFSTEGHVC